MAAKADLVGGDKYGLRKRLGRQDRNLHGCHDLTISYCDVRCGDDLVATNRCQAPSLSTEGANAASEAYLDIGANDGSTTLSFLKEFANVKIYAFEPDPRAAAKFKTRSQ